MAKKIQMMSHDKEWQIVNGVETLVPVEQIDIDPITDSSAVQIEGHRTLEETLATKHQMTPEIDETKIMSKVGGVYHQNVVDGAYEEAILYGNSKVNLMEDDTTTAQPIPLTFTSFNNGLQKELALGNNTVAPMLKGVTLINRALTNSVSLASGEKFYIHNLKGNTVHTVSFKFTTKNTNAGVVIESCTGETYLENSMHKTGLGDNVIFTVTTHANADSIAIVNNAAYGGETIKLDDIMVIEGDQTLMNLTFFKGMRSVELVKPLENLFRDDLGVKTNNSTVTNSGGTVTVTSSSSTTWSSVNYYLSTSLKQHTKYLVMWDSATKTHTATANPEALISVYDSSDNTRLGCINNNSLCPTQRSLIFDTEDKILSNIVIRIHATQANTETGTTTVKGLRVFEWDNATSRALDLQGIGYFSGTKNVSIPNFKTNSKNLYPYGDVNFTSAGSMWYDAKGNINMYGDIASKSQSRFLLRKGTYTLSIGSTENIEQYGLVDDKEGTYSNTFTLQQDTYMTLRFKRINANTLTTATNIQIERGDTATSYVSYDTRQYKSDNREVVVLRSLPNGVCDTFNLQTGEYVQNIGEATLDGTKALALDAILTNTIRFRQMGNVAGLTNQSCLCDKMVSEANYNSDYEHIYVNKTDVWCFINRASVSSEDVDGIRQYLKSNPLTVQYQLSEPIIKQIPIVNSIYNASSRVDFKECKNANFRCFGNPTYLEVGSLSPVNPIVEPIINIPLNARLKANTSYTVRFYKESGSLNVDLGGTTVSTSESQVIIKTPLVLSHNQIRFSGNGIVRRVMVFEGDIRGIELPYFMGINNVKMPIVRNTGKNLFNINDLDSSKTSIINDREFQTTNVNLYTYINIKVKPNTTYSICFKAYKDGGNASGLVMCIHDGKNTGYYDTTSRLATIVNVPSAYDYRSKVFTTKSDYISLSSLNNVFIKDLTIIESNTVDTDYIPYRGNDICLVQGEINLSQDMFEVGGMVYPVNGQYKSFEECKSDSAVRIRTKECIPLKSGVTYRISCVGASVQTYFYDASKKSIEFTHGWNTDELTFTTPTGASYMSLMFKNDSKLSIADFMNKITFQFLELDSTVQLRSLPNGVKDELNLLTGEYIQRVGEVVLNGKNNQFIEGLKEQKGDYLKFGMQLNPVAPYNHNVYLLNDRFNSETYSTSKEGQQEQIYIHTHSSTNTELRVCILPSKLSTPDNVGFNSYLQSNPITVQYELAEPIISYPRIVSNTQEREVGVKLPNGVCDTYNPSTGITVKRVGKMILDGSEDWYFDENIFNNTYRFILTINDMINKGWYYTCTERQFVKSNMFRFLDLSIEPHDLDTEHLTGWDVSRIVLNISKNKVTEKTTEALKTYLSSNPITLWYELKNPIVTTDIVLPNGVHDEYNPLTGLYTKRVGYIELDGGERSLNYRVHPNGYLLVDITDIKMTSLQTQPTNNILSNVSVRSVDDVYSNTNITTTSIALHHQVKSLMIRVVNSSTTVTTIDGYKTYLSQNPIKVWYELATPITYQLTPYFGLPMPYAYKDGYLIMDSAYEGQTLPPEIKYKLLANRTGQITQNNIKLQNHTSKLSNLEAMLVEATLQSMYEREMMAFNLEMVNINLINLEE